MLFEFDNRENMLYDADEAFCKGNSFISLYNEYKNYKPGKLTINSKKEEMSIKLMMLDFYLNDLNLYLILHRNDEHIFNIFKKYEEIYKDTLREYEKMYGPLEFTCDMGSKYSYVSDPWPWDGEYV